MKNLNELKKHIISNIQDDWSTLEKVRYIYLESGKYLVKHTEFFFTLDNKSSLSPKKLDKIYMGRLKKEEWNKMVCKTGAEFIKEILDELKIKSSLVETVKYIKVKDMKHHLHHFTLCVNIDGNNIFLTPISDYPYIKRGMATKHFGISVPYIAEGEIFYKGREIPHITLSKKELKEIDDKLGYTTKIAKQSKKGKTYIQSTYVDDYIRDNKNAYIDYLALNTDFYNSIMPEDEDERKIKYISDSSNDWDSIIDTIGYHTMKRVEAISGKKMEVLTHVNSENYELWLDLIKKMYNKEDYDSDVYYSNINLLVSKVDALCRLIIDFSKKDTENLNEEELTKFRNSFNRLLFESSKHFIEPKYVIEPKDKDKYVLNSYINHKFSTYFPYVMDSNNNISYKEYGSSEQIEYVKKAIEYMFMDLSKKNLLKDSEEEISISPIFKRVSLCTARDKITNGYIIFIAILNSDESHSETPYWYEYNIDNNTFERTVFSRIALKTGKNGRYQILSNRLRNELEAIENAKPRTMTLKK